MPSLGADMEAGTLVEWLVKPGDRVKRGDIVAVVDTQKGAIEIEVFEAGEIEEILVGLDAKVPVGTPLARIRTKVEAEAARAPVPGRAEASAAGAAQPKAALMPEAPAEPARSRPVPRPVAAASGAPGRVRASPAARRLAQRQGLDLAKIAPSAPGAALRLADVEKSGGAAAAPAATPAKRSSGLDLDAMRVAIAAAMTRSKREIPHYYLEHQVDMTAAEQWLAKANASRPPESRLLMAALAVKAVALAARRFPAFNGFYRDGKYEPASAVHVGVGIALRGGGLTAPALHDADRLPLDQLMNAMRDLIQRMRAGRIRGSELADPTITVSSLGERGVEVLYGVIYPPQVAILGFGKMVRRPWLVDDALRPCTVVTITLSADHRVSDGHAGALFLAEIGKLLQEPEKL
jgi:pyruvate dehydrogenase E2 component (dihydrolipoamide acetyltransferase)